MNMEFATNSISRAQQFLDHGNTAYMSDELKDAIIDGVRENAWYVRDPYLHEGEPDVTFRPDNDRRAWEEHRFIIDRLFDRDMAAYTKQEVAR